MFWKFVDFKVFLLSLAVGLLFVYLSTPSPTVIVVYPTPETVDKLAYEDKAGNCYKFSAQEVECPSDASKIKRIPVQQ